MRQIDLTIPKGALFSDDRKFRYALWRAWNPSRPILLQIGLNPSVANECRDDPTITRGIVRADREGFGAFLMGNLYGYVSTNPKALLETSERVGEQTDYYLREMINMATRHLCGWGSFKPVVARAPTVLAMIKEPYCVGVNSDGQPTHPLYVAYNKPMVRLSR